MKTLGFLLGLLVGLGVTVPVIASIVELHVEHANQTIAYDSCMTLLNKKLHKKAHIVVPHEALEN